MGDAEESRITPIVVQPHARVARRDKWHCAFFDEERGRGGGEEHVAQVHEGRVKCIMWNGEWMKGEKGRRVSNRPLSALEN